jgi:hypothetical protein
MSKIIGKGIKAGVKKITRKEPRAKIDAPKDLREAKAATAAAKKAKSTKTVVRRSEAPIQSERSKITAANATAANTRQSKSIANKAFGANAASGVSKAKTPMFKGRNKGLEKATVVGIAATPAIVGGGIYLANRGKKPAPAKVTFADAFREARAKGEGTKFTHDGKPYVAVTKTDLKKKGYDDNELGAYNKRGGKARGPLNRLGQGVKKVLLGKDKKFGGDKGAIDFIRKPVKKAGGGMMSPHPQQGRPMNIAAPQGPSVPQPIRNMTIPYGKIANKGPGLKKGGSVKKYKGGGMATKGLGKAFKNSKR